jgi:hypothetical protein
MPGIPALRRLRNTHTHTHTHTHICKHVFVIHAFAKIKNMKSKVKTGENILHHIYLTKDLSPKYVKNSLKTINKNSTFKKRSQMAGSMAQ